MSIVQIVTGLLSLAALVLAVWVYFRTARVARAAEANLDAAQKLLDEAQPIYDAATAATRAHNGRVEH